MNDQNKNRNNAAANNENAVAQEVNINLGGGGSNGRVGPNGRDCFGLCNDCKSSRPTFCPIAQQYLPQPEYYNYCG